MKTVEVGSIAFSNSRPLVLIGGINVLESRDLAMRVAEAMKRETERRSLPYVFKASFDKANRSSNRSYRGPGLDEGIAPTLKTLGLGAFAEGRLPYQGIQGVAQMFW